MNLWETRYLRDASDEGRWWPAVFTAALSDCRDRLTKHGAKRVSSL